MPMLYITLNGHIHSDSRCSGGEGALVRVSQTPTLDFHTGDICKEG